VGTGEENGVRFAFADAQREFRMVSDPPPIPLVASRPEAGKARSRRTGPDTDEPPGTRPAGGQIEEDSPGHGQTGERSAAPAVAGTVPADATDDAVEGMAAAAGRAASEKRGEKERRSGGGGLLLAIALLVFAAYAGWKILSLGGSGSMARRWPAPLAAGATEKEPPAIQAGPEPGDEPAEPDEDDEEAAGDIQAENKGRHREQEGDPSWGSVLPFIDKSRGVEVPEDRGLLVVEAESDGEGYRVQVDGREMGSLPLGVALEPGRHELRFRRGGVSSFRFVVVQTGRTRVVQAP